MSDKPLCIQQKESELRKVRKDLKMLKHRITIKELAGFDMSEERRICGWVSLCSWYVKDDLKRLNQDWEKHKNDVFVPSEDFSGTFVPPSPDIPTTD